MNKTHTPIPTQKQAKETGVMILFWNFRSSAIKIHSVIHLTPN